jgi:hypothetical protein
MIGTMQVISMYIIASFEALLVFSGTLRNPFFYLDHVYIILQFAI